MPCDACHCGRQDRLAHLFLGGPCKDAGTVFACCKTACLLPCEELRASLGCSCNCSWHRSKIPCKACFLKYMPMWLFSVCVVVRGRAHIGIMLMWCVCALRFAGQDFFAYVVGHCVCIAKNPKCLNHTCLIPETLNLKPYTVNPKPDSSIS